MLVKRHVGALQAGGTQPASAGVPLLHRGQRACSRARSAVRRSGCRQSSSVHHPFPCLQHFVQRNRASIVEYRIASTAMPYLAARATFCIGMNTDTDVITGTGMLGVGAPFAATLGVGLDGCRCTRSTRGFEDQKRADAATLTVRPRLHGLGDAHHVLVYVGRSGKFVLAAGVGEQAAYSTRLIVDQTAVVRDSRCLVPGRSRAGWY